MIASGVFICFCFQRVQIFQCPTKLQHYLTIRRLEVSSVDGCVILNKNSIYDSVFLMFFVFPKIQHQNQNGMFRHIFLKLHSIDFSSTLQIKTDHLLVRDLSINFANINTTISNTLLIIAHFLNSCFILVDLQRDLFRNYIQQKQ